MSDSTSASIAAAVRERLSEADAEDHFYGPWHGGSKASGGRPMTKAEAAMKRSERSSDAAMAAWKRARDAKTEAESQRHLARSEAHHDRAYAARGEMLRAGKEAEADNPAKVQRAVMQHGVRLAKGQQETETGVLVSNNGNVLYEQAGHGPKTVMGEWYAGGVDLSTEQLAQFKDAHFVHNHPTGSGLSVSDIYTAASRDAASMHSFRTNQWGERTHQWIERPPHGWLPAVKVQTGDLKAGQRAPGSVWMDAAEMQHAVQGRVRDQWQARINDAAKQGPEAYREAVRQGNRMYKDDVAREIADWWGASYHVGTWGRGPNTGPRSDQRQTWFKEGSDDHYYGAWHGGPAASGGHPVHGGPSKNEVTNGVRAATAASRLVGPDAALATLAAGGTANVASRDVAGLVARAADRQDDPNLLNLRVDGKVFGQGHYARTDLPQVPSAMMPKYLSDLRAQGISVRQEMVRPGSLKPMQREVSVRSTARMLSNPEVVFAKRVIVSSDGHVLDGHHRWGAATIIGMSERDRMLGVVRIGLPRDRLVQMTRAWSNAHGIERKKLGESSGDHFYGAWHGGSRASGGGPQSAPISKPGIAAAIERVAAARGNNDWKPGTDAQLNEMAAEAYRASGQKEGTSRNAGDVVPYTDHHGLKGTMVLYRGPGGERAGHVFMADYQKRTIVPWVPGGANIGKPIGKPVPSLMSVSTMPSMRGKGMGTAMYDWVQDHTSLNLYPALGRMDEMTPAGKAFALKWLEHRVKLEQERGTLT